MKKFLIAILILLIVLSGMPHITAYADPAAISALSAAAYAMAQQAGINFSFTAGTAVGAQDFMESRLGSWASSHGGISIFGSTPVRAFAGKLAITQSAINQLKNFFNDLIDDLGLDTTPVNIFAGYVGDIGEGIQNTSFQSSNSGLNVRSNNTMGSWWNKLDVSIYYNGSLKKAITINPASGYAQVTLEGWSWSVNPDSTGTTDYYTVTVFYRCRMGSSGNFAESDIMQKLSYLSQGTFTPNNAISGSIASGGVHYPDIGLDDLQGYKREDWSPDTNLESMLSDIFADRGINDLILEDEVISESPVVTPVPTTVPGSIDDVIGQLGEISGTLEGVQEGVGEAVGQLEGINEGVGSISEALEVPTASEAPTFKFDLTTLFPFCIPFDIYRFVTMFSASPVAPHVQIPFNIPAINLNYTFDLDFSSFDSVASVLRSVELIAFCVGLAILTSKVIRW